MYDLGLSIEQMHGKGAIHVPLNMIFQRQSTGDNKYQGVWQFQTPDPLPLFEGDQDQHHILLMGDAIIRPRVVLAGKPPGDRDSLTGYGIGGVYTSGFNFEHWDLVNPIINKE